MGDSTALLHLPGVRCSGSSLQVDEVGGNAYNPPPSPRINRPIDSDASVAEHLLAR